MTLALKVEMPADIVCFSHLRWGFVYQRPNHLMARFARERRVFFCEEPLFDRNQAELETVEVAPGVTCVIPHLVEGPREETDRVHGDLLSDFLATRKVHRPVGWFYTPMALDYARGIPCSFSVYDCMDELSAFRGAPPELLERERELFRRARLVFTGGQSLYRAKRNRHASVYAFPSSVDASHFGRARQIAEPDDQKAIPRPRVGFFGVIDERFDLELLARVADELPDVHFVLIGPIVKIDPASVPRRANVHTLGPRSYEALPAHLAGWDVAMMPFALNEATRFISPTKTLEYLAAGRPVVSTAVQDVVSPYGEAGLVRIADAEGFGAAIQAALAEAGSAAAAARRAEADAFVASTSWDRTWSEMEALLRAGEENPRSDDNIQKAGIRCSTT